MRPWYCSNPDIAATMQLRHALFADTAAAERSCWAVLLLAAYQLLRQMMLLLVL
jgi:hypothetical protein